MHQNINAVDCSLVKCKCGEQARIYVDNKCQCLRCVGILNVFKSMYPNDENVKDFLDNTMSQSGDTRESLKVLKHNLELFGRILVLNQNKLDEQNKEEMEKLKTSLEMLTNNFEGLINALTMIDGNKEK